MQGMGGGGKRAMDDEHTARSQGIGWAMGSIKDRERG